MWFWGDSLGWESFKERRDVVRFPGEVVESLEVLAVQGWGLGRVRGRRGRGVWGGLSWGEGRCGEGGRVAGRVEGRGGREAAWAAQVTVVQLPQQLLVLHRQTLVDLGLLLQGLLQHGLLRGQLPAGGDREQENREGMGENEQNRGRGRSEKHEHIWVKLQSCTRAHTNPFYITTH